jgi:hypothetical protein
LITAMEALAATLAVVLLMVGALALMARTWPRSSRLGGYRARAKDGSAATDETPGVAGREDDDAHWNWR